VVLKKNNNKRINKLIKEKYLKNNNENNKYVKFKLFSNYNYLIIILYFFINFLISHLRSNKASIS